MSWHSQGKVNVVNGSPTVTGVSSNFSQGAMQDQGFVGPDGRLYQIVNIPSATQLSINPPYQGPTASNGTYLIAPLQGYVQRLVNAVNELTAAAGIKLNSLAEWAVEPTASGAMDKLGFSGSGKTVATGSQAQGRAALQLGTAAQLNAQASVTDGAANTLLRQGAWGLGANANTYAAGFDFDTVGNTSLFQANESGNPSLVASGLPGGLYYNGVLWHRSAAVRTRMIMGWGSAYPRMFIQSRTTSGSGSWLSAELWSSANLAKQANNQDATAGAVMINGAWGLGGEAPGVAATVELASRPIGFQYQTAGAGNPFPAAMASMNVRAARSFALAARNLGAYIYTYGDPVPYLLTLCHNRNMVGTVADVDGIPSGAIIETGTNANGTYTKLADGTLILRTPAAGILASYAASTHLQASWTLPHAVIANSGIGNAGLKAAVSSIGVKANRAVGQVEVVTSLATLRLFATGTDTFASGESESIRCVAIGRWKA